jgi:hypothetical protein
MGEVRQTVKKNPNKAATREAKSITAHHDA